MDKSIVFCFRVSLLILASSVNAVHAAEAITSPNRLSLSRTEQQIYRLAPFPDSLPVNDDSRPFARQIAIAAREAGLDPELVHAVIAIESGYHSAAVSPKGAIGLMQVLPETAHSIGIRNPVNVKANLRAGTRYLSILMEHFDNRLDLALAAYNAGEGAVRRYNNRIPPYAETRHYVPAVEARYQANNPRAVAGSLQKREVHEYLPGTRLDPQANSRERSVIDRLERPETIQK